MAAITNLATLKENVATALVRTDFTDRIAAAVPLAEAWLNRNLRLRMMESDQALVGVASSASIALPTGFLEPLSLILNDSTCTCPVPMRASGQGSLTSVGRPTWYAIDGANIVFNRPCDAAYSFTLHMLTRFALSADTDTNALLTAWPDLYLMAVLAAVAGVYLTDDPRLGVWVQARDGLLAEVLRKEARSKAPAQLSADAMFTQQSHRTDYSYRAY